MLPISNTNGLATVVIEPVQVNITDSNKSTLIGADIKHYDLLGNVMISWKTLANTNDGWTTTADGSFAFTVNPSDVNPGTIGEYVFRYIESQLQWCKIIS